MVDLRYPVGEFVPPVAFSAADRAAAIRILAEFPARLRLATAGLTERQLDTPYRPDGWTIRQVVHHVPDSHLNAYIRFKWTLTESNPTIKPYDQEAWATLADTRLTPVSVSLDLLEAVHRRWVVLLESVKEEDWQRPLIHPESGPMTLDKLLQMYAWHGRHHLAHVASVRSLAR